MYVCIGETANSEVVALFARAVAAHHEPEGFLVEVETLSYC